VAIRAHNNDNDNDTDNDNDNDNVNTTPPTPTTILVVSRFQIMLSLHQYKKREGRMGGRTGEAGKDRETDNEWTKTERDR
jgi:hypothetical protein